VQTPNLDRLVKAGTTFTHAYNMGAWSGAVCVPSRTMLNPGRFLWTTQKLDRNLEPERAAGRLWALEMKRAGYDTCLTGKWHLKTDAKKVFAVTQHIREGMPHDSPEGYDRPHEGQPDVWKPWDTKFGGYWEGGKHWSEVVGDDATEFLGRAANAKHPFFMYIAFNAPHDPRQSPKEFVDKYPLDKIKAPANFVPEYPYKDGIGCGRDLRDERLAPFPRTEYAVKVNRQEYYALITHMDEQVGRILDALDKLPDAKNTYVIFTADQGLAVGHHGLIGKQNLFDDSVRVPLLVVGPGVAKGRKISAPVYLQDIMPTSASRKAVASLMPSPMKPTVWPRPLSTRTTRAFCIGESLAKMVVRSARRARAAAVCLVRCPSSGISARTVAATTGPTPGMASSRLALWASTASAAMSWVAAWSQCAMNLHGPGDNLLRQFSVFHRFETGLLSLA